jgi:hypothetical protein
MKIAREEKAKRKKNPEALSSLSLSLSLLSCTVSTRTGVSEGEPLQNLRNTSPPEPSVSEGEGLERM